MSFYLEMEIQACIKYKKELYEYLSEYFQDDQLEDLENLEASKDNISIKIYVGERDNLTEFLNLIACMLNHHHRDSIFIKKVEQILEYIKNEIKQTYSNIEIFQIFNKNKLLLLYLIEHQFIQIDEQIVNYLSKNNSLKTRKYFEFFYNEIKSFLSQKEKRNIEQQFTNLFQGDMNVYENNRHIGENETYLCKLIREDLVEDFVKYVNQTNLSLSETTISTSIFETNLLLLKKEPKLIEYSMFFGSIQIFQYLRLNDVELTSSLWIYAIHSNNPEFIHLLEEYHVKPPNNKYEKCLKESIKCHHNEISNYFIENYDLHKDFQLDFNKKIQLQDDFDDCNSFSYHYHNYEYFKIDIKPQNLFYYSVKYNYLAIVKLLINNKYIKIKDKNIVFFFIY
ncbi:hypothetical protein M9Y10_031392 [Tritrichomonas musculus]|uniref:DUF3447 domain-containing protein n=1 Tax=Tritrichomonas musculus TaxID=1915356 RepID=A0ABR2H1E6_9EUKA